MHAHGSKGGSFTILKLRRSVQDIDWQRVLFLFSSPNMRALLQIRHFDPLQRVPVFHLHAWSSLQKPYFDPFKTPASYRGFHLYWEYLVRQGQVHWPDRETEKVIGPGETSRSAGGWQESIICL